MDVKTCLITGATSGIGLETCIGLAQKKINLIIISRCEKKLSDLATQLVNKYNIQVRTYVCDLSSIKETKNIVDIILNDFDRIDIIINNVGAIFMERQINNEGIEITFALNHLSYFALTTKLLDGLKNIDNMRIINVSSNAHKSISLDFDNLENLDNYNGWHAYKRSKLANIYFTYHLAATIKNKSISVNCLHPGVVNTNFANNTKNIFYKFMANIIKLFGLSSKEGAETSIYLASDELISHVTGQYFDKCRPIKSSEISYDHQLGKRLWHLSEKIINEI